MANTIISAGGESLDPRTKDKFLLAKLLNEFSLSICDDEMIMKDNIYKLNQGLNNLNIQASTGHKTMHYIVTDLCTDSNTLVKPSTLLLCCALIVSELRSGPSCISDGFKAILEGISNSKMSYNCTTYEYVCSLEDYFEGEREVVREGCNDDDDDGRGGDDDVKIPLGLELESSQKQQIFPSLLGLRPQGHTYPYPSSQLLCTIEMIINPTLIVPPVVPTAKKKSKYGSNLLLLMKMIVRLYGAFPILLSCPIDNTMVIRFLDSMWDSLNSCILPSHMKGLSAIVLLYSHSLPSAFIQEFIEKLQKRDEWALCIEILEKMHILHCSMGQSRSPHLDYSKSSTHKDNELNEIELPEFMFERDRPDSESKRRIQQTLNQIGLYVFEAAMLSKSVVAKRCLIGFCRGMGWFEREQTAVFAFKSIRLTEFVSKGKWQLALQDVERFTSKIQSSRNRDVGSR